MTAITAIKTITKQYGNKKLYGSEDLTGLEGVLDIKNMYPLFIFTIQAKYNLTMVCLTMEK